MQSTWSYIGLIALSFVLDFTWCVWCCHGDWDAVKTIQQRNVTVLSAISPWISKLYCLTCHIRIHFSFTFLSSYNSCTLPSSHNFKHSALTQPRRRRRMCGNLKILPLTLNYMNHSVRILGWRREQVTKVLWSVAVWGTLCNFTLLVFTSWTTYPCGVLWPNLRKSVELWYNWSE